MMIRCAVCRRKVRRDHFDIYPDHLSPVSLLRQPSQLEALAGRQLVAHVGKQTMRVPVEFLVAYFTRQMQGIEEWKQTADPLSMTLYTGLKQSLNIMIPLLREFMKRAAPDMPQLPERPRHSDPVVYLLGYMNAFTCDYVTRGEFTIPVDEDSEMVTGFAWSYLDELRAELAAGDTDAAGDGPLVIDAEDEQEEREADDA